MIKLMARITALCGTVWARGRAALAGGALAAVWATATPGLATSSDAASTAGAEPDSLRVPILVYHSIAPHHPGQTPEQRQLDVDSAVFEAQMQYLADHKYNVVSLGDLVTALEGGKELPGRSVVITFDDGWAGQYKRAFPVLRQLGFTATFFIYSRPIGKDPRFMNWDQVRELHAAGMTIGSHSRTHPLLTNPLVSLPDELERSRQDIQRELGVAPDLFAYPFGAWDMRVADAVRAAGFRAARAYPGGFWNRPADLYALRSTLATEDMQTFLRAIGP